MSYRIIDLELTSPPESLSAGELDSGVAVIVRYRQRPLGFWMGALAPGETRSPDEVVRGIGRPLVQRLLSEKLREAIREEASSAALPSLTMAICTKDRPHELARCLDSIAAAFAPERGCAWKFEILIVDNAPSDGRTSHLVSLWPGVRYVCESKTGLDFARNRAVQEAEGELLAFIDDDALIDLHWPAALADAWAENPDAGGFTGLILPSVLETDAQILFERAGGFRNHFNAGFEKVRFTRTLVGNWRYPYEAGIFGSGANMVFRREVLRQLGGFDEALDTGRPLPGGGDLDMFYRLVRAGHPLVYEPGCLVFHEHRRTMKSLERQYWSWGLGFMSFIAKIYASEPEERAKLRRLVRWWFRYHLRQLGGAMRRRERLSSLFLARQIWGGLRGICGEYRRSRRRIQKIRHQCE